MFFISNIGSIVSSIFNYGNALAFKSIDDADLDSVQEKVRTILYEMLNENENGPDELFNKRVNAIFLASTGRILNNLNSVEVIENLSENWRCM